MNNVQALAAFDVNQNVTAPRTSSNPDTEHAVQVMAMETLRALMGAHTLDEWNAMSDCSWLRIQAEACDACRGHLAADIHAASITDIQAGANLGGNYFEHGYQSILDGTSQEDQITFTRTGGIQS